MVDIWVNLSNSLPIIFLLVGLIIVYFIIREIRLTYTKTRMAQLDLEKEKLQVIKADFERKENPFFRISPGKMEELKSLDDENSLLETDIYAQQNAVEKRIQRLESKVRLNKLDHMIEKIKKEEDRLK
ncbi:MAG: hypothetical protein A4E42_00402 [Methanoregulaceae archaeon PtaU1.Bin222]|jgi:flagellar biosynthesis/type III secretory pathway M-ring protein FliF/YscJ|nr:MAG: hypothetical protein A4E42_00402 [Methanoregulaceae archaeon PtaU1.Bin222]